MCGEYLRYSRYGKAFCAEIKNMTQTNTHTRVRFMDRCSGYFTCIFMAYTTCIEIDANKEGGGESHNY